jgi:hypothetical protein
MKRITTLLCLVALVACGDRDEGDTAAPDRDGDGVVNEEDCGPDDPQAYPGADEIWYDGVDQDCDGLEDDDDKDGDGWGLYGDSDGGGEAYSEDCDDDDPEIHPGADELCDELNNDCDGEIDEDAIDAPTWYPDEDGDGAGADTGGVQACEAPEDYVSSSDDCDDESARRYPGAQEDCDGEDNDCDGAIDEEPDACDEGC